MIKNLLKFLRKQKSKTDVALIYGGLSHYETDVSCMTMKRVAQTFDQMGISYRLVQVDSNLIKNLKKLNPQRSFLAVHGLFGEDGGLQSLLELLNIPYTGSGVAPSALCMDKIFFKEWMSVHKILIPKFKVLEKKDQKHLHHEPPFLPCVVKPCSLGSSLGVSICHSREEWKQALENVFKLNQRILIEEYIQGKEIAVPLLESKSLTPVEIVVPSSEFYDFKNKYHSNKTQYFVPARLETSLIEKLKKITEHLSEVCQVRSYGRADFIVRGENVYLIEMNTLPGLTEHSLVPKSAQHEGISYQKLIQKILDSAF